MNFNAGVELASKRNCATRTNITIIEHRTEMRQTAIKSLQEAEEALTALAMSYELQPDDKASSCHPRTGTLSTASQVRKLRRVVEKQKT